MKSVDLTSWLDFEGAVDFTLTGASSKSTPLSGSGALVTLSTNSLIMFVIVYRGKVVH